MMLSTLHRRRAAYDFSQCYEDLCCSHGACPLAMVTQRTSKSSLVCSGERIRPTDWIPLCRAMQMNKSLESVKLMFDPSREQRGKSRRGQSAPAGVRPGTAGYQVAASRMDRSAVVQIISRSLGGMIRVSPALATLSLEGITLRFDDVTLLAKGFTKTSRLHNLSLAGCKIGDSGAEVLCTALQASRFIQHLDLSLCSLTWKSASALTKLMEHHANWRYAHLWQVSLRQVKASTDGVGGLRRLSLSANPLFGDRGVCHMMDALQDDIWIKAIDMQHCGLSNIGVRLWLNLLRSGNLTLMVVDLRQNTLADKPLIRAVMEQIVVNGHGINDDPQFLWLSSVVTPGLQGVNPPAANPLPKPVPRRRPKQPERSATKPPNCKPNHHRSRSVEQARRSRSSNHRTQSAGGHGAAEDEVVVIQPARGLPWRTAARCALRRRRTKSEGSAPINLHFSANSASSASDSDSREWEGCPGDGYAGSDRQPIAPPSRQGTYHQGSQAPSSRRTASSNGERSFDASSGHAPRLQQQQEQQHSRFPSTYSAFVKAPHQPDASRSVKSTHSRHTKHRTKHAPWPVETGIPADRQISEDRAMDSDSDSNRTFTLPSPMGTGEFPEASPQKGFDTRQPESPPRQHQGLRDGSPTLEEVPAASIGSCVDDGTHDAEGARRSTTQKRKHQRPAELANPNLAGLQQGTGLDDQLLERFEVALNKFSEYLTLMKNRNSSHLPRPQQHRQHRHGDAVH